MSDARDTIHALFEKMLEATSPPSASVLERLHALDRAARREQGAWQLWRRTKRSGMRPISAADLIRLLELGQ